MTVTFSGVPLSRRRKRLTSGLLNVRPFSVLTRTGTQTNALSTFRRGGPGSLASRDCAFAEVIVDRANRTISTQVTKLRINVFGSRFSVLRDIARFIPSLAACGGTNQDRKSV